MMNVDGDYYVRFGPGCVELQDLFLLEIHQHGSTLQLILARTVVNTGF